MSTVFDSLTKSRDEAAKTVAGFSTKLRKAAAEVTRRAQQLEAFLDNGSQFAAESEVVWLREETFKLERLMGQLNEWRRLEEAFASALSAGQPAAHFACMVCQRPITKANAVCNADCAAQYRDSAV